MRVATGDLNDVDTQLVKKALELGDALDLEAPTANTQGEGRYGMRRL